MATLIEAGNGGARTGGKDHQPRRLPISPLWLPFREDPREDADGVGKVRGEKGDLAVVFSGRAFLNNIDYLTAINTAFAVRNLGWSERSTHAIMGRALNVDLLAVSRELTQVVIEEIMGDPKKEAQVPSVMLIRKATADPGQYFAISSQRKFYVPTSEGEKRVDFHILRSVNRQFRGHSVGRWMVDLLLNKHEADYYIHRSSNPMALDTNRKTPNLRQTDRVPYDKPYYTQNEDGSIAEDTLEHEIAQAVLDLTVGPGYKLTPNGVVKGLYREQNTAFVPDEKYPDTYKLYQKMIASEDEGGYGMDLVAGDTLMPIYRVH